MQRARFLALCLGLSLSVGQAQTTPASTITLELRQPEPVLAGQSIPLQLTISQRSRGETVIGGLRDDNDTVPCPLFKVYDKAGGPPLIERYVTSDCDPGVNVTFHTGQNRFYNATLPMKLTPGQYTAILTLRSQPLLSVRTTVNVGPGPFVAELVLPNGAQAEQPLDLRVAFRNVWRSAVSQDLRLCGTGLLIRDKRGNTVYDNKPEDGACIADDLELTTVAAGGVHLEPWGTLPALKAGWYTAILWGVGGQAMKLFQVNP